MIVICDFDGTITPQDTTDRVLEALADPAWRTLEAQWVAGEISAANCMRSQVALIGGSRADLDAVLDETEIDPGFADFAHWANRRGLPVIIVSDGVDYFINRILMRHGLEYLPVVANRLAGWPSAWKLEQPWSRAGCAAGSGVCKCQVVKPSETSRQTIAYVGDGRSDFCASARSSLLFAKGALAEYVTARGQAFTPFDTFHDVTAALERLVGPAVPGPLQAATF